MAAFCPDCTRAPGARDLPRELFAAELVCELSVHQLIKLLIEVSKGPFGRPVRSGEIFANHRHNVNPIVSKQIQ